MTIFGSIRRGMLRWYILTINVADIAYSLGFDEVAHFSNYFKKQTTSAPLTFRA
ncbi:hypothetical protein GA0116948_102179 [Chitinophaga costaii]|uniref:HTH araC/xylS-type domain-containing protein n=1 Tax=Chitinophaga costaii TaxID=1335309 RepID=A0A1C4AKW4_9BACT|nr:hypothetical protein [Chitinophaga costaii]SCB95219.1 hypothetical protein GA0116948_102179 [Chitinophaga costaii]